MTRRQRTGAVLVALAVVVVLSPLPDPLVLALVLGIGAVATWCIYRSFWSRVSRPLGRE